LSKPDPAINIWEMNRRWLLTAVVALPLLTAITYIPALRNGFIWDDDDHFVQNPAMIRPDGLRRIWSSLAISRYYPLTLTTFWAERKLWGLNPVPYHAVNVAVHALNAVLVFCILKQLGVRGAWGAAALWAIHPVNVESVAWATELKNIQSGLFFFLSFLCFLQFERRSEFSGANRSLAPRHSGVPQSEFGHARRWYALSLVSFAAALLSKPSTVVLPLLLLLLAWWQRGRVQLRDVLRSAPFFVLATAMSLLTIIEQRGHIERAPHDWSLNLSERFVIAAKALWFYAAKLLLPVNLSFIYPRWNNSPETLMNLLPLLSGAIAAALLWRFRNTVWGRATLFGIGYFVVALLPILGLLDIYFFRYSFVADHFQYLASIGPLSLLTAGVAVLSPLLMRRMMVVLCMGVLVTSSWKRLEVFRSNETLWTDTVARNPHSAMAHNNLGMIFDSAGDHAQAVEQYRRALAIQPDHLEAQLNLGSTLTDLAQYLEAEQHLKTALEIKPDFAKAHYALGKLYVRLNRLEVAKQQYALAIRSEPGMAAAHYDLGCLWQQQGQRERAIACYENALLIRPDLVEAHYNLANMLSVEGRLQESIGHYQLALKFAPSFGSAQYHLGLQLMELRRFREAIEHFQQAVLLMPSLPDCYVQLAAAYAESGGFDKALSVARQGLSLAQSQNDTNIIALLTTRLALYKTRQR
jgi:tetratricopeptide (TPR) repeat protein